MVVQISNSAQSSCLATIESQRHIGNRTDCVCAEHRTFSNYSVDASVKYIPESTAAQAAECQEFFAALLDACTVHSNRAQDTSWSHMGTYGSKPSSFVSSLARHHGLLGSDSIQELSLDIYKMSKKDWDDCKTFPQRRSQAAAMLMALGKDNSEIEQFLAMYDQKISAATFEQSNSAVVNQDSSLIERMRSCLGAFFDDYSHVFETLQFITPEEKEQMLSNPKFRKQVIGFMDPEHQEIAMQVVQQGRIRPEDRIRTAIIADDFQTLINQIIALLPHELDAANRAYTGKYHSLLAADAVGVLPDRYQAAAAHLLTQDLSLEEISAIAQFNAARR